MPRARKVCSCRGCAAHAGSCPGTVAPGVGRCLVCTREAERRRGTARQRGYDTRHEHRFRREVLAREPFCRLCYAPATVADHWPRSRRELVASGEDPNDPRFGRALCTSCHSRETARWQPGGWNTT